jgi:hypothetical protein
MQSMIEAGYIQAPSFSVLAITSLMSSFRLPRSQQEGRKRQSRDHETRCARTRASRCSLRASRQQDARDVSNNNKDLNLKDRGNDRRLSLRTPCTCGSVRSGLRIIVHVIVVRCGQGGCRLRILYGYSWELFRVVFGGNSIFVPDSAGWAPSLAWSLSGVFLGTSVSA